jgi:predicted RNase H-like HicB family nuclease
MQFPLVQWLSPSPHLLTPPANSGCCRSAQTINHPSTHPLKLNKLDCLNFVMTTEQEHMNSVNSPKEFYVVIERDEDGIYVGEVPQLPACYSQGETIDELMVNIREVIELCLEEMQDQPLTEFIGIQKVVLYSTRCKSNKG